MLCTDIQALSTASADEHAPWPHLGQGCTHLKRGPCSGGPIPGEDLTALEGAQAIWAGPRRAGSRREAGVRVNTHTFPSIFFAWEEGPGGTLKFQVQDRGLSYLG